MSSGAAVALTVGSTLLGQLHPAEVTLAGWGWLACLAVVSTVGAISFFFAGLKRVGPTSASILATVEPLVTVLLAFLVFGETLGPLQLARRHADPRRRPGAPCAPAAAAGRRPRSGGRPSDGVSHCA